MATQKAPNKWLTIGATMLIGLFVAYLDRSNLSIALTEMGVDLGFAENAFVSSSVVTAFSIGYAVSNVLGGVLTRRMDPKTVVTSMVVVWSAGTIAIGFINSVPLLYVFRILLGICEGFYWPQMSRIVLGWFAPEERTRANSIVQYYGQFLALAIGFFILTPIHESLGWRALFIITGALGIVIVTPLYLKNLKPQSEAPYAQPVDDSRGAKSSSKLTLEKLGGASFFLLLFAYLSQGMLFWGITLWIPTVVKALGFSGYLGGALTGVPYLAAVLLAIPMTSLSDKTGKRTAIAVSGMVVAGLMLVLIAVFNGNPVAMIVLITIAMGYYASCFTPNIWTIIQTYTAPDAVGAASGIVNGVGAGLGGTIAGYLVGLLYEATGSYVPAFATLGAIVIAGGVCLTLYGRINEKKLAA